MEVIGPLIFRNFIIGLWLVYFGAHKIFSYGFISMQMDRIAFSSLVVRCTVLFYYTGYLLAALPSLWGLKIQCFFVTLEKYVLSGSSAQFVRKWQHIIFYFTKLLVLPGWTYFCCYGWGIGWVEAGLSWGNVGYVGLGLWNSVSWCFSRYYCWPMLCSTIEVNKKNHLSFRVNSKQNNYSHYPDG